MKSREQRIAFEMNYCQHYGRGKGADMVCSAGMDLKVTQQVAVGEKKIKWGPCIEGHTLANPLQYCPHWLRRTREQGEKRADAIEKSIRMMEVVMPTVEVWRNKPPIGKAEVIECPECKGKLHLSQAAYNGHVFAKCETPGCVSWME
jgi:hypothetical protein